MHGSIPSGSYQQSDPFGGFTFSHRFTAKQISYGVAGALVIASSSIAVHSFSSHDSHQQAQHLNVNTSAAHSPSAPLTPAPANQPAATSGPSSTSTNLSTTTDSSGNVQTSLNVNGRDIPVPQNGSVNQTIDNQDGSTTTVNVSGNSNSQGSATSNNSSSVTLNVNSSSQSKQTGGSDNQ